MKKVLVLSIALAVLGCKNTSSKNSSEQSTQIEKVDKTEKTIFGTYKGILPCASCPGIETVLTLNDDKTFVFEQKYLEQKDDSFEKINGSYSLSDDKTTIILDNKTKSQFKIEENSLQMLSSNGSMVKGELSESYKLKKLN